MFHVVPENFFSPLASPNKRLYWECIRKLFQIMDYQLSFGLERDVIVDELQFYFDQSQAYSIVEEDEEKVEGQDSRAKANWILKKLREHGWIEIVTDKSYVQRVHFREYAVKMIRTMLEVAEGKPIEYQAYIHTIYTLVKSNPEEPGTILMQIVENTDLLISGLKNLNSNIKHYIDELTEHRSVAEIMDALFHDYMTNIVDKAYHRLRTSDNVAKFRPEIVSRLESKSRSRTYVQKASRDIARNQEMTEEDAEEQVYRYIHQVVDAFQHMDDILTEIDEKNTQYQRSAVNRARFLLTSSEDVRGQLKEILMGLGEQIQEQEMAPGGIYHIQFIDEMIRLYTVSFLDEQSLFTPIEGRKEFVAQAIQAEEADPALRREKLRQMMEKMDRVLTPQKIDQYVQDCLQNEMEKKASAFPLSTVEEWVRLIYIRLYGQRKNMSYVVVPLDTIRWGNYRFTDFLVRRK